MFEPEKREYYIAGGYYHKTVNDNGAFAFLSPAEGKPPHIWDGDHIEQDENDLKPKGWALEFPNANLYQAMWDKDQNIFTHLLCVEHGTSLYLATDCQIGLHVFIPKQIQVKLTQTIRRYAEERKK